MRIGRTHLEAGKGKNPGYLDGQILVAMPTIRDERFSRTVIYLCAHSSEGAMGIVINQPAPHIDFGDLLVQLEVIPDNKQIELPSRAGEVKVLKGGPVETERGFVLHSADFFIENSTLPIDEGVCLTATLDILKAIARGAGPASAILALGYAGWSPGQLESELQHNGWLHCSADPELIFGTDVSAKYDRAMEKSGKIAPGSRIDLGRVGLGVVVREGTPAPDISTPEAVKAALIKANTIAYTDPKLGATSVEQLMKFAESAGIKDEVVRKGVLSSGAHDD